VKRSILLIRRCPRWHQHLTRLLGVVLLFCCFTDLRAYADGSYQLGQGYDFGPLNFAGYSNMLANLPRQGKKSLVLDDLSLFVAGHLAKPFNPFVEAELTHFDFIQTGPSSRDRGDGDIVLERFYNDSYLTDSISLRLGKMLTPVGEWNQIHAAPLVLTTVRPAVTYRNFSEYATGVSILYDDPSSEIPDLQIYWQPHGEFSERPGNIVFHQYQGVEGAHVSFPMGLLDKIGFSFQESKDIHDVDQSLYGLDFHYTVRNLTFEGEGTFSDVSGNGTAHARDTEWGVYGAASYAFDEQWSLYSWYEEYADRAASSIAHDVLVGVAYRPHPAIVVKLEYLQNIGGQPVNPSGLFASWSVLF